MPDYTAQIFEGDYPTRQRRANDAMATCYIEQHFNSGARTANYACVIVANNASRTSKLWGKRYLELVCKETGFKNQGVIVGGFEGRGNGNLSATRMPAILVEPCFITNQAGYDFARFMADMLAKAIADSIQDIFPDGGLVALSIGHKGKTSNPGDKGARGIGGLFEAELATPVIRKAKSLIEAMPRGTLPLG